MALVREAHANKEIAFRLHLAEGTIKEYLNRVFRKLGVSSRTELAILAVQNPEILPESAAGPPGVPIPTGSAAPISSKPSLRH